MNARAQLALQAWVSPAYPVGAYAYSHALEWEVECGRVYDLATLQEWVEDILLHGAGRTDAILISQTCTLLRDGADEAALKQVVALAHLATAMTLTSELRLESLQQGQAFLNVTCAAWPHPWLDAFARVTGNCTPYSVCIAVAAAAHGVERTSLVRSYLQAQVGNWISAAVRMNVVGQSAGQILLARSGETIAALMAQTQDAGMDALGSCAFLNDIASLRHERQTSRLFRS